MALIDDIKKIVQGIPADLKENKGVYTLQVDVAERKVFLSKKKLVYIAKFRIVEPEHLLKFTEMLKETGFGLSSSAGDEQMTAGYGFKTETYKVGLGGERTGTIKEQSTLFGKQYKYTFDFSKIRNQMEGLAQKAGYKFKYQITPIGL